MINYHYAELIYRQAEKYGNRTALRYRDDGSGRWLRVSWNDFAEKVRLTAMAMAEFGIQVQENIGVCSQNMPECFYTYFGAYSNRVADVPSYATSSPEQIAYIVKDANIHTLFVGEQQQYNNALIVRRQLPGVLSRLVVFDPSVKLSPDDKSSIYFEDFIRLGDNAHAGSAVKIRISEALPEDIATIIYTSGTTGHPKGVVLRHANYLEAMRTHAIRIPQVNDKDVSLCFLPLTHIFERGWSCVCLTRGTVIAINRDPKMIQRALREVCPTVMCSVPRFWEKVYIGAREKIRAAGPLRAVFEDAIRVGRAYHLDYERKGERPPLWLGVRYRIYRNTVFALLKRVLGLQNGRFFPVAGAPLADNVLEFLLSVDLSLRYGYGLSETTATVSFFPEVGYEIGSIGTVMPDLEVRIDPANSEILVKGKTVMSGYYKMPEENARAFTEDGFFRTGDAGYMKGDVLYFKERIKDLYKTSNGKYIAPQSIELSVTSDAFIEQVAVIGDERKFVSALIVPAFPLLEEYARSHQISYGSREELLAHPAINRLIESRIEACQKHLAPFEKIKRFTLLPAPFTIDSGELTDTLKLRRRVILERYASLIEAMYQE